MKNTPLHISINVEALLWVVMGMVSVVISIFWNLYVLEWFVEDTPEIVQFVVTFSGGAFFGAVGGYLAIGMYCLIEWIDSRRYRDIRPLR